MTSDTTFVIVGASLTGALAAETLREQGYDGRISLIGDEPNRPYERPPLSKDYLLGRAERETVFVHPEDWYAEHDVDLRLGREVTAIDRSGHEVVLDDGARLGYDKLLLATGSTPRRLSIPGSDLAGIHYLRRIEDSERIQAAFRSGRRVAVIGGGWIGLETAAAARAAELEVVILEQASLPLVGVLGPEVAQVFADAHRAAGVDLRCEVGVEEFTGEGGAVTGVRLADGSVVAADVVLVGVGITPNTGLALSADLDVDNGILADEHLRTVDPDIFVAGDVANAYHPVLGRRIRVEHWANARNQGAAAARSMLGEDVVYDRLPYFFTDQYDIGMEYTGYVEPGGYDDVVFRGDAAVHEFLAFWTAGGKVLAGMNVNVWDVTETVEQLILGGRTFSPDRLADTGIPLDQL
jgi:3-phenylpropionate/trans-cinnamate dioxygenase ferredoxin reductase subunit